MRKLCIWFLAILGLHARAGQNTNTETILNAVNVVGRGSTYTPEGYNRTFECFGTIAASTGSATIDIMGSNIASPTTTQWLTLGAIALTTSVTGAADGFASSAPWRHISANVVSVSGSLTTLSCYMGIKPD